MTSSPLVSIIVNNYNYDRYLGKAIDSALAQTWPATEVIVVDDGSTDGSRRVIEGYGDRVLPVYKKNGGQGSAYNAGFAISRGELVCFLDADDTLFTHALTRIAEQFADDKVVKVQWPAAITDARGRLTGKLSTRVPPPDGDLRDKVILEGPLYDFEYHTGSCYRRSFLEEVFPVPEPPYRNGADVYLITTAPVYGLIATIDEPLSTYRWHDSNNYSGKDLSAERLNNYVQRFESNCSALQNALASQGVQVDPQQWRARNFNYRWPTRLLGALDDIASLVPAGSRYVLVNGDEWGMPNPVADRHAIPFLEHNGDYWGPPPNEDTAISELERLRREAAPTHLVLWQGCFWWLKQYPGLFRHLHEKFEEVRKNDRVIIFDIRASNGKQRNKTIESGEWH